MPRTRRERLTLWTALFSWPAVIGVGWVIDRVTGGRVPMAIFPIAWLAVLAATIVIVRKRETGTSD